MNKKQIIYLTTSLSLLVFFCVWTLLVVFVDVKPLGVNSTNIGLSTMNVAFFNLTKENMTLYTITDWLGLVSIAICFCFGMLGLVQLIKRKSLFAVDKDILILGVYYIIVILMYLIFEMIPINYRPILIEGRMETSYPSSTTLLVLSVAPTLSFEIHKRIKNKKIVVLVDVLNISFSLFMVIGRLLSGVHWLSDIIGSIILSGGLFALYLFVESKLNKGQVDQHGIQR